MVLAATQVLSITLHSPLTESCGIYNSDVQVKELNLLYSYNYMDMVWYMYMQPECQLSFNCSGTTRNYKHVTVHLTSHEGLQDTHSVGHLAMFHVFSIPGSFPNPFPLSFPALELFSSEDSKLDPIFMLSFHLYNHTMWLEGNYLNFY